jgi:predicted RNA-binding Zn-ribbon protein involved in translation (DUF1610 family)
MKRASKRPRRGLDEVEEEVTLTEKKAPAKASKAPVKAKPKAKAVAPPRKRKVEVEEEEELEFSHDEEEEEEEVVHGFSDLDYDDSHWALKAKKAKAKLVCAKCGGSEILRMRSSSWNGNSYTLPCGITQEDEAREMPDFPPFTRAGAVDFKVCVDCGTVVGFNSAALKEAIAETEQFRRDSLHYSLPL